MIKSILDNDLYKFTMMYAVLNNKELSNLKVRYQFFNRDDVSFPEGFDVELQKRVQCMSNLKLTTNEKSFFKEKCGGYLPKWFFDFIDGYKYDPNEVFIFMENGKLKIKIEGYWYHTILWEVPLMSLISEIYFEMTQKDYVSRFDNHRDSRRKINLSKSRLMELNGLKISDFGTRRRFSYSNHYEVVKDFMDYAKKSLVGTSNVHLAHKFGLNPHGTMAHEFIMVHSALYGYQMANKLSMDTWNNTYRGSLGTVLPDTFTTDIFFKSFDSMLSREFDSIRHDSGCPFEFTDKVIKHYKSHGIDPMSKTIIFSDGLDIELSIKLREYCTHTGIKCAFGIGTFLTNDVYNEEEKINPLNMVIKITDVFINNNWVPTIKLSDNPGKHTGDKEEIELSKKILKIS